MKLPGTKTLLYAGSSLLFVALVLFSVASGSAKEFTSPVHQPTVNSILMKDSHTAQDVNHLLAAPLPRFLMQLIIIVFVARITGSLFRLFHQPSVVGEIFAGILLGPSLLGKVAPELYLFVFPPETFQTLYILSELGLVFFMFIIGMELDLSMISMKARIAAAVSYFSIATPFVFGMVLAWFLYTPGLVPPGIDFVHFALFIGTLLSVTAFPVLARICRRKTCPLRKWASSLCPPPR